MTSIIEELAAKTRAGGSGALPSAATSGRKSSIILELAAKSGMNINADINTLKNATATGADTAAETEQKQNTGGFFGGVGYLANKVGVGFVSSLEGISDYVLGGMAKLFGADDWAEEVMGTDWFDYSHPENWYNPSRGWQVAGDVFGGIGTSLPAIGTVAAAAAMVGASGGALTPLATGLISAGVAGLAAAGRSTSEAYKRTGTLGGKEWAYGTLSGITEGGVEGLSTALGLGAARLGTKLVGSAGGNAAKELIKTATFGGVLKEMGKSFIGEASEEAISEILDPVWQRMTIDEYAPSATAKEVGYAALVGGLSGILMDGTSSGIQHTGSILRGNRINGKGNTASVLDTARSISDFEGKNKTGIQDFAYISEAYGKLTDSIKSTDGKVTTMAQKKLLGDLAAANNSYNIKRFVATDAFNIVSNAEAIAENLEKFGYRTVDGKEMRYSAAELTAGYDAKKPKSIYKALETNEALRSLAVTAATGRLLIDTARTEQATLAGEALMSKADLARFLETASAEEIHGVEEAFGIEDLRTADADTLRNRIIAFSENGGIEAEMQKRQNMKELAAIPAPEAGAIPTTDIYMEDGEAHRYTDGDLNIAISRKGDAYLIYDYNTKKLSRELSEYEMNEYLSEYRRGKDAYIAEQRAYTERQAEKAKRAELSREVRGKADAALRENIKGYATSPATLQAQLRKVYHDAVVSGISEADALSYARVSERTGLDMIFSRELCATADGSYADGYYDPIKNRIVINPETKRAHGALLMHELTHAIYYKDGTLTIAEGIEKMPAEKKQAIMKKYTKAGITDSVTLADEMNAHYAEETLRSFGTLEKLCADKPTLKEKILSFFRGAETDYKGDAKLTKAAKQLYAQYKKLFDSFAAKGRGSNGVDLMPVRRNADTEGDDGRRYSVQDGKVIVDTDQHIFDGVSREDYGKVAREYIRSHLRGKTVDGTTYSRISEKEYTHSKDTQRLFVENGDKYSAKMRASTELVNLVETGKFIGHEDAKHIKPVNYNGFDRYSVSFTIDRKSFSGELLIAQGRDNVATFYDIVKIKESNSTNNSTAAAVRLNMLSDDSIHENSEKVNTLKEKGDGKRYALPDDAEMKKEYNKPITAQDVRELQSIGKKSINEFTSEELEKSQKWAYKFYRELGTKSPFFRAWFGDWRAYDTANTKVVSVPTIDISQATLEKGDYFIKDTGWTVYAGKTLNDDTRHHSGGNRINVKSLNAINAILDNAILLDTVVSKANTNKKSANTAFLHKLYTPIIYDGKSYIAVTTVEEYYNDTSSSVSRKAYNLKAIKIEPAGGQLRNNSSSSVPVTDSIISISELYSFVKRYDKDFSSGNAVNESLVNEDGTPLIVYHGTDEDFTVFDSSKGRSTMDIQGMFFSPWEIDASGYGSKVGAYYLNLHNPAGEGTAYKALNRFAGQNNAGAKARDYLIKLGYDGVNNGGEEYIAFYPHQIKSVTDNIGTFDRGNPDIRYALPEGESAFDAETADAKGLPRSMGQVKRTRANNRFERVYSKKAAINVAGKISGIEFLSKKAQAQVVSDIWETLNNCTSMDEKLDAAHTAADSIVTKLLSEAKEANPAALEAQQKLVQLRTGLHRVSFSETDAAEIIAAEGEEKWKSIRSRWGYQNRNDGRGGNRIPMDVFVTDISREMQGMERFENMHPADAFIEMNRIYEQAQQDAKNKWTQQYLDADADEIQYMTDSIRDTIMKAFAEEGEKSAFAKTMEERLEKAKNTIAELRADNTTIKKRIRIEGLLAGDGQRLKDIKIGTFGNATQFQSENLKGILGMAAKINYRGGFNATGARKVVQGLRNWYNDSDVQKFILGYKGTTETGLYSADVAGMLEELSNPRHGDAFTNDELSNLHKVYQHFIHITENYGKIYRHGRMVEALPIAEEKISIIENNRQIKRNPFTLALTNVYGQAVFKPIEVVRAIDGYENGFNTEMVLDIREASEQAAIKEMGLKHEYDDFFSKNKKYAETLQNERMTYADITMPKSRLIALYMTYKREQAQAGLLYNGYKFRDTDGSYISSLPLLTQDTRKTKAEIKSMAESIAKEIESKFSATDKQYIAILERAFEAAGKLKMERDIQRMGYSNLTGGYYFPIVRANSAKSIDSAEAELDRVSNASFNKDTVKGAKQRLFIGDADAIFRRHIHAVSQYNALSPVIEAYNTLYNLDISGNPNAPKSIATEMENVWESGNRYMKKLFSDVQGIRGEMDVGNKAVNFLRGGYAKYQLGLNPKTWFKQLTSLAASTSILDWDSLSVGVLTGVSKDVDTYCPLAALRNYEDTAAMAQSVLDTAGKKAKNKLGRFSDALMTPIGKIDRFVVERLFGGCQVQVAKESGGKLAIGTEANKVAAGKMLAQVIRDTQQNALATEKSAAMRSNNEIVRAFTMFTADGVAVMSKMLGTYGEYWTLREKLKTATDANVRAELTARLKTVGKAARKSTMALISTAIFGAGVDFFFRWLFNKLKDKPEDEAKNIISDTMMGMIGGLPIIKDIVSKAFEGYDIKNYTYSAMNDMISSLTDLVGTTKDWLSNKDNEQARNKALKNFAYSMGQVFGLPVRNTYNLVYGLTKRIVPSTAYEWDTHFYTKTYGSDFSAALEKDDTDTASFILSLMTKNEVGGELDEKVRSEFVALAKSGNKVLPKSVPNSITVDGTAYKFTRSEKEAIREEYASVNATVKKLVSNVRYRIMDESTRAYALKYVYSAHLEKAYSEVLYGGARDAEMIAADLIGIDMMAIAKAIKNSVQGDTGDDGKVISGSKRQNIIARIRVLPMTSEEKLLLIAMLGYKIQAGDIGGMDESRAKKKLLSYIFAQRLTADEKAALCIKCGFEVKNGRVSTKNL